MHKLRVTGMAFCQKYFLLVFLGLSATALAAGKSCEHKLHHLADDQKKFLGCSVLNSAPIYNSCSLCYNEYTNMSFVYDDFVRNCSENYLNKNHLNIVYNTQKMLIGMWNIAFCDDCFENGIPSNSKLTFDTLQNDLYTCVQKNTTSACERCPKNYISLNTFFKEMEDQKSGKICFDIQDKMNATRLLWSKELQCCHRQFSITLFLIGSSIFGVLPLLFYFGMYAYTKRLEQNHEVIDSTFNSGDQLVVASTSGNASSGSLAANVTNEPSTSTRTVGVDYIADIKKPQGNLADEVQQEIAANPTNTESLINL